MALNFCDKEQSYCPICQKDLPPGSGIELCKACKKARTRIKINISVPSGVLSDIKDHPDFFSLTDYFIYVMRRRFELEAHSDSIDCDKQTIPVSLRVLPADLEKIDEFVKKSKRFTSRSDFFVDSARREQDGLFKPKKEESEAPKENSSSESEKNNEEQEKQMAFLYNKIKGLEEEYFMMKLGVGL